MKQPTLLKINDVDYSKYIIAKSFVVNQNDVLESWVDFNHKQHSTVVRTQVVGSMDMKFNKDSDIAKFRQDLEATKVDGIYKISIFVNNIQELKEVEFYMQNFGELTLERNAKDSEYTQFKFQFEER